MSPSSETAFVPQSSEVSFHVAAMLRRVPRAFKMFEIGREVIGQRRCLPIGNFDFGDGHDSRLRQFGAAFQFGQD